MVAAAMRGAVGSLQTTGSAPRRVMSSPGEVVAVLRPSRVICSVVPRHAIVGLVATFASIVLLPCGVALADTVTTNFEPPLFHTGSVNGQDGWKSDVPGVPVRLGLTAYPLDCACTLRKDRLPNRRREPSGVYPGWRRAIPHHARHRHNPPDKSDAVGAGDDVVRRPCLACGELTTNGSYCPVHAQANARAGWRRQDARRGSTVDRGYGADHVAERLRAAELVRGGSAYCVRCGGELSPDEPFDLDHSEDRTTWIGASHRACNRSASRGGAA